jgi:hypothetical protein
MTEIFLKFIKEGITPNAYYILHCIKHKIMPNTYINKELEKKKLINDNWITNDLQITNKSIIFTDEIESYFKKSKKKTSKDLMGEIFLDNIKVYNEIFPNKKLSSGKYARVNPKTLENAFRWFFETYDYDWATIIQATEKYVNEYEIRRYEYMRTSQYFVRKQNTDKTWDSDLATYCDLILSGSDEEINYFKERIV